MIEVIVMLAVIVGVFRLSLVEWRWRMVYSFLLAVGMWWSLRYAVQLSKPALIAWLQTTEVRQYVAIAITLDTMLMLAWCLAPLRRQSSPLLSALFTAFSFSLPPALFYLLVQTVFMAVGTDFHIVGLVFAVATALLLPFLAGVVRGLTTNPSSSQQSGDAALLIQLLLCALGLLYTQHTDIVYQLSSFSPDQSILSIIMDFISKALFGIANALLIPDIILLIFFFVRALILLGTTYTQFMKRRSKGHGELFAKYLSILQGHEPSEAYSDYVVAQFEAEAQKDVNLSRLLTKLGPVLGLIGTLISMSPALVGLSTGDIAGMAYNMQVVFSATVVGLFISAIGLFTQQLKSRWYAKDASRLDYESQTLMMSYEEKA